MQKKSEKTNRVTKKVVSLQHEINYTKNYEETTIPPTNLVDVTG
jgi:hypothetical protein